jgi:hypothetical protein
VARFFGPQERAPPDGEVDAENQQQKNRNANDEQSFPELFHSTLLKWRWNSPYFELPMIEARRIRSNQPKRILQRGDRAPVRFCGPRQNSTCE